MVHGSQPETLIIIVIITIENPIHPTMKKFIVCGCNIQAATQETPLGICGSSWKSNTKTVYSLLARHAVHQCFENFFVLCHIFYIRKLHSTQPRPVELNTKLIYLQPLKKDTWRSCLIGLPNIGVGLNSSHQWVTVHHSTMVGNHRKQWNMS